MVSSTRTCASVRFHIQDIIHTMTNVLITHTTSFQDIYELTTIFHKNSNYDIKYLHNSVFLHC